MLFGKYLPESIAIRQIVMTRLVHGSDSACVDHEPQSVSLLELVDRDDPVFFVGTPEDIDWLITEASSESGSGWQPIETAPKDGTPVLLWAFVETELGGRGEKRERVLAQWEYEKWRAVHQCYYSIDAEEPTHWMPIPEHPTEAVR